MRSQTIGKKSATKTRVRVSWRLVIILATLLAAACGGALLWYEKQKSTAGDAIYARYEKQVADNDWDAAAKSLFRYVKLNNKNAIVWAQLAQAYDRSITNPSQTARSLELHLQAIGQLREPKTEEDLDYLLALNERAAELMLLNRKYEDAMSRAEKIIILSTESNPTALKVKAMGQFYASETDEAKQKTLQNLVSAMLANPTEIDVAVATARCARIVSDSDLYMLQNDPANRSSADTSSPKLIDQIVESSIDANQPDQVSQKELLNFANLEIDGQPRYMQFSASELRQFADLVMDSMVEANEENDKAWLQRFAYRRGTNALNLEESEADLQQAIELVDQSNTDAILNYAVLALQTSTISKDSKIWAERSRDLSKQVIDAEKTSPLVYLTLGDALNRLGESQLAVEAWQKGLEGESLMAIENRLRLINYLLGQGKSAEAREHIETLQQGALASVPNASQRDLLFYEQVVDYLVVQLDFADGKYQECINNLRALLAIIPNASDGPRFRRLRQQTLVALADARLRMGNLIAAIKEYEQAAELGDPGGTLAMRAADLWQTAGAPAASRNVLERFSSDTVDSKYWLRLAQMRLNDTAVLPDSERDWTSFETALAKAKKLGADEWQVNFLAAGQLLANDKTTEQGLEILRLVSAQAPNSPDIWQRLTFAFNGLGQTEDADKAKATYDKLVEEEWKKLWLEHRLSTLRGLHEQALESGKKAATLAPEANAGRIQLAMSRLLLSLGRAQEAREILLQLHNEDPVNGDVLLKLADLDFRSGATDDLQVWEDKLKAAEGESGVYWRYVRSLRLRAEGFNDANLQELGELQQTIEAALPGWTKTHILKGDLLSQLKRHRQAAQSYREAIRLGDNNANTYQRLVQSLYAAGEYEVANTTLQQLQNLIPMSQQLAGLSLAVAAKTDSLGEMLRKAQKLVETNPKNPDAHIWLGQIQSMNNELELAEKSLQEAVRLENTELGSWIALFSFYVNNDQAKAQATLDQIAKLDFGLTKYQKAIILGEASAKISNAKAAIAFFNEASSIDPSQTMPHIRLAQVLLTTDTEKAEAEIRRALKMNPDSEVSKRLLASILSGKSGTKAWQELENILASLSTSNDLNAIKNRRLKAMILARRGGRENLAASRSTLEELVANNDAASSADRALLATAYEMEGNYDKALEQYQAIVKGEPNAREISSYINFLLRQNDLTEAKRWLDRLASVNADGSLNQKFAELLLNGQWLEKSDQVSEIPTLIDAFVQANQKEFEQEDIQLDFNLRVGNLFESLQQYDQAEKWYEEAFKINAETSQGYQRVLAQLGRHQDAIDIAVSRSETEALSPSELQSLIEILAIGEPSDEVWKRANQLMSGALNANPDNLIYRMLVAAYLVLQDRNDDAIKILEDLNTKRPDDNVVINNLATILGQTPGRQDEALALINQAIELSGPKPYLLDTKSVILVELGRAQEAVELLTHLATIPNVDPLILFRIAVANQQAGEPEKAQAAYRRAVSSGLSTRVMTRRDKELLQTLKN